MSVVTHLKSLPCGCRRAEPLPAPGTIPKSTGRLRIDRPALRRALGDGRLVEALEAKAKGRPGANVGVLWRMLTTSLYQSGDLPLLATREALQNSADSVRAAVRARQFRTGEGRFDVRWDPFARTLSWSDNGVGMSSSVILNKFLVIGESGKRDAADSGEAAGGFGVAKAVILGASRSFRWTLVTQDNRAVCEGEGAEVSIFDAPYRQGAEITVFDVDPSFQQRWDHARQAHVSMEERLRELLAANDLPDLHITLNGEELAPLFSRRGGGRVKVEGAWGRATTAAVKAYRRPQGDRQGAYYIRLNGLMQYKLPSQRGKLKADIVIDLSTSIRPGEPGYPLNAARDALQDQARWTFQELVEEVERENERVGATDDDEVFEPGAAREDERVGAALIDRLTAEAFEDPELKAALRAAAGGIEAFFAEQAATRLSTEAPASKAAPGSLARGQAPDFQPVLPPGFRAPPEAPTRADEPTLGITQIAALLEAADQSRAAARGDDGSPGRSGILTPDVRRVLRVAAEGQRVSAQDAGVLDQALATAVETALEPGGGGLLQVASVASALQTLERIAPHAARGPRNPFHGLAGLRISKKRYDRKKAARFKKSYHRAIPLLTVWDATLRLIAQEARIRRRFRPGFVLDDEAVGLTETTPGGQNVIYVHPDRLTEVIRAHRERPIALAAFLHGLACHELTHLDGRMGQGHDEEYIVAREDLGAATAHLLPVIARLAVRVLRLPEPVEPAREEAERLRGQLARIKEGHQGAKKCAQKLTRCESALVEMRDQIGRQHTTTGTRVRWSSLRAWLNGWATLAARRASAGRTRALAEHLAALPEALVEAGPVAELDDLDRVLREQQPPRGKREGHPTTRLLDAVDRTRAKGKGRGKREIDVERVVAELERSMLERPPSGVTREYVRGFWSRNRNAVLRAVARMRAAL